MLAHLQNLYAFYGEHTGVRVARKHVGWYLKENPDTADVLPHALRATSTAEQMHLLETYFANAIARIDRAA